MHRKIGILAGLVFGFVVVAAPAAAAPAYTERGSASYDVDYTVSGLCAFDIATVSHLDISWNYIEASNGTPLVQQVQIIEQDTVTGPGGTLVGLPFRFNESIRYDSSGNVTGNVGTGGVARFVLPDGSIFWSAGVTDFTTASVGFLPQLGHSGNVDALCEALA